MHRITIVTKLTLLLGTLATVIAVLATGALSALMIWQSEGRVRQMMITQTHEIIRNELMTSGGGIQLQKNDNGLQLSQVLREQNLSLIITSAELKPIARYGIYRNFAAEEMKDYLSADVTDSLPKMGKYRDVMSERHGMIDTFTAPLYSSDLLIGYLQTARLNDVLPMIYSSFGDALLLLIPGLWLVSVLIAGWASRLVLSPLTTLVKYMEHVEVDSTPRIIAVNKKLSPELMILVRAINQLLLRVASAIVHERELTDNISHELKTPLTRITTTLQTLATQVSGTVREKLRGVTDEAVQMGRTIETILSLARVKHTQTIYKPWNLLELVTELGREIVGEDRLRL